VPDPTLAVKRSNGLCRFYQSLVEMQPPGQVREFMENMARTELNHKDKLEYLYDNVAFPELG
jgi:rubrerythrin